MKIKYKEIWEHPLKNLDGETSEDFCFCYGQAEEKQTFCCHDLEVIDGHLEYSINDKGTTVRLEGHPDSYDCSYEYVINFCPFCGEKFEFESLGKYEKIVENVKSRRIVYNSKVSFKKI